MPFNNTSITLLLIYFLAIILFSFSRLKSAVLPGKVTFLLRAFLPSWKFFEDCEYAPQLLYRFGIADQELSPWRACLDKPPRRLGALLLNADGNFLLMANSLVMQLITDLEETDEQKAQDLEKATSYRLMKRFVRFQILSSGIKYDQFRYQFKLMAIYPNESERCAEEMLISPVYEA